jgi:integrase
LGTIIERRRKDGSIAYLVQITIASGGSTHRENRTFDRRQAALVWLEKRERELNQPGGLDKARHQAVTLGMAIDRYISESEKQMGRTKAQVLRTIQGMTIANKPISTITSADLVAMLREIDAQPSTRGNYLSHISTIFALARPAWGYDAEHSTAKDAASSAKRLGITAKSKHRSRRPTLDELDRLMDHFQDRETRRPAMMPMTKIIVFALFSARRQEEITRIRWDDLDPAHSRILVRDMKNPGEKLGNDVWCDLPEPALKLILSMPRTDREIFPYTTDAISANFTRACQLLGIEDLVFHDLRHEAASRLFEMGLNIPHVAAVTGHRSWQSLKRYTHLRTTGDKYQNWTHNPAGQP